MTATVGARATAERLAVPVVSCLAAGLPLSPLDGLSRAELRALVTVLAENVDPARLLTAAIAAAAARAAAAPPVQVKAPRKPKRRIRRPSRRDRGTRWRLPTDGIIDEFAIELAVTGKREVPLTTPERLVAAQRILAAGGTAALIAKRLHMNGSEARKLAEAALGEDSEQEAAA
jgi:hypothetical protein